jgi:tetratricopeptide (TPR) repeat protein
MGLTADAIGAAEEALIIAPPRSRLAALAVTFAAHGYALSGDQVATERAYDDARELLGNIDVDPDSTYGVWPDEHYIAVQRARSLAILGDYHSAALSFQDAIGSLPGGYLRDRGVYLARAALAHAGDHEWERAATLGLDALIIGIDTGSGRILTELVQLDDISQSGIPCQTWQIFGQP